MDFLEILKANGIEVPKDKTEVITKAVKENYKTNSEYEKVSGELDTANKKILANDTAIKDLEGKLAGFKDVDVTALNERIKNLETEKSTIEADYKKQIEDRDFNDLVKDAITVAKGKNTKAIMALLDTDTLKKSKNQKDDVVAALKTLTEADDSKMLFGEPQSTGTRKDVGGHVPDSGAGSQADTLTGALAAHYNN
jgi:hypothetical protein|nr:MAG TPA: minor structural protein [Caudoviricetes sp.]